MRWMQVLLIVGCVCLSALAQILLKAGAAGPRDAAAAASATAHTSYQSMLSSPATLAGLAVYAASALLWLRVLANVPLSQAYPFVALGILLTTAAGVLVFGEAVVGTRIAGTMLIAVGVLLVGYR